MEEDTIKTYPEPGVEIAYRPKALAAYAQERFPDTIDDFLKFDNSPSIKDRYFNFAGSRCTGELSFDWTTGIEFDGYEGGGYLLSLTEDDESADYDPIIEIGVEWDDTYAEQLGLEHRGDEEWCVQKAISSLSSFMNDFAH